MREKLRKLNIKIIAIVALCICIAAASVEGVYTYLMSKTDTLSNNFVPAVVTCEVEETFQNGVKTNVKVRNTGNTAAYIRAAVVVTFVADDGKVLATSPIENVDYTITWANSGWKKASDGYWYHADAVEANGITSNLIETASAVSAPDGYKLNIQIIATAIQSTPDSAVQDAWGITPTNGKLILD